MYVADGATIKPSESGPPLDLAALAIAVGMGPCAEGSKRVEPAPSACHKIACPAGWSRKGTDIRLPCDTPTPQHCAPGKGLVHTIPSDITASSVYKGQLNKTTGAWVGEAYVGWIQLVFPAGTLIGNVSAEIDMSSGGAVTNTLKLDTHPLHAWVNVPMKNGMSMNWAPPTAVKATELHMTITKDPSWVAFREIRVFAC
jgi:hypothetical protein